MACMDLLYITLYIANSFLASNFLFNLSIYICQPLCSFVHINIYIIYETTKFQEDIEKLNLLFSKKIKPYLQLLLIKL